MLRVPLKTISGNGNFKKYYRSKMTDALSKILLVYT